MLALGRVGLIPVLDVLRHYLVIVIAFLACVGCARNVALQDGVKHLTPEARRECAALGGQVERILIGADGCVRPTTDGGQSCMDSSKCQGTCVAPFGTQRGTAVTGTCAPDIGRMGCPNVVVQGKASGEACFD
jgi:hypothetical protein